VPSHSDMGGRDLWPRAAAPLRRRPPLRWPGIRQKSRRYFWGCLGDTLALPLQHDVALPRRDTTSIAELFDSNSPRRQSLTDDAMTYSWHPLV
jgi:hypothetical protein